MDKTILSFLPIDVLSKINDIKFLEEVRIRINKKVLLKYKECEMFLDNVITYNDLDNILEKIFKGSRYSYQNEIVNGFITIEGGHRIGIVGNVVIEEDKIKNINNITSLNIRISKVINDCSNGLDKYIVEDNILLNTLIVSSPGQGKTTILKDLIKRISNGEINNLNGQNVGVVDERMELSGSFDGRNQIYLGEKTDVITNVCKDKGMKMMIRSMAPQVIVVDEIGTKEDVDAIKYAVTSGIKGIFTAHGGDEIISLYKNPILKELIECKLIDRIIFLSKKEKGKIENVYENTEEGYKKICLG